MRKIIIILVSLATLIITGCGSTPQPLVPLQTNQLSPEKKIGIYVTDIGEATTNIYGAGCLLCYGVASAANSSLSSHLESLSTEDITSIKQVLLEGYRKQSSSVEFVNIDPKEFKKLKKFKGELGFAKQDFRSLKDKLNIDVLVVLNIVEHGAFRSYSSYIPTSDPQGYVNGLVYSVDLSTNQYLQYLQADKKVAVEGEWDEPKVFPGVTNAYYQAVESVKDTVNRIFL
ncbi:hypothetical protein Sden_3158 [Shewanella denitrificans OS217]|uniref:Lipoprotein n=1 Tax=Shewanella denitrificans (strain OS217 / ATCC BAA-1090 / DSM 15013) TaxID=318161 RepID=Q12JE2_SHEDO|nr:hypothetical protein [Shewanella denitrificans]ABE56434.1 hypothetical protein Sden_3158 [Shewanella denitrificans OS217]